MLRVGFCLAIGRHHRVSRISPYCSATCLSCFQWWGVIRLIYILDTSYKLHDIPLHWISKTNNAPLKSLKFYIYSPKTPFAPPATPRFTGWIGPRKNSNSDDGPDFGHNGLIAKLPSLIPAIIPIGPLPSSLLHSSKSLKSSVQVASESFDR